MRPIVGQNPEAVLGQTLTNDQKILWNFIFNTFRPITIIPLYYSGAFAAPLTVYNANILYVYYSVEFNLVPTTASVRFINLHDAANAVMLQISNNFGLWDVTAAAGVYGLNNSFSFNGYFSRIAQNAGTPFVKFIGYVITY